jgi:hypothetical protein
VTNADKDEALPSTPDRAEDQATELTKQRRPRGRLIAILVAVCLLCALGLVAIAALDALIQSPALTRATPTPAFSEGMEVRLVAPEYGPVTVWQVGAGCERGLAFGQMPSGSEGRIADGFCYNRKDKIPYQRIVLSSGAGGWVAGGNLVSATDYTPPTPTETVEPTPGPTARPTPTAPPTATPVPAPLPPGSALSAGNWEVRVERVEVADTVYSAAGDESVQANGRFALVYLAVANRGARPATLHASSVVLQDAGGAEYRNNDLASAYASSPACADFVLDLESGAGACLIAAIDIPAQSGSYALSLSGAEEWVLLDVP